MSDLPYEIISTGSHGNAVLLNDYILVDCGVSYKALQPYIKALRLVLLTHAHGDHFNRATIRRLAYERPALRFGGGAWLAQALIESGVGKDRIDILSTGRSYRYGDDKVIPVPLQHNVPNQGYKIHFGSGKKAIYATDTSTLAGITAKDYDLYMIEANYEDEEIVKRIHDKVKGGEYAYEINAVQNHLSKEKCDEWIYKNIGSNGVYIYMHQHQEPGRTSNNEQT